MGKITRIITEGLCALLLASLPSCDIKKHKPISFLEGKIQKEEKETLQE